ncbi:hypothetical protein ACWEFL_19425 [Streptomyces sp. NPDC004838]
MERIKRTTVTAITTAALLAGSVSVAMAVADPAPSPHTKTTTARQNSENGTDGKRDKRGQDDRRGPITARATSQYVHAWQQFRVYGTAKELRPGTKVSLQQKQGKRWVTLPVSMKTSGKSTYKLRVTLGLKGPNNLRIVGGGQASAPFTVTVR